MYDCTAKMRDCIEEKCHLGRRTGFSEEKKAKKPPHAQKAPRRKGEMSQSCNIFLNILRRVWIYEKKALK